MIQIVLWLINFIDSLTFNQGMQSSPMHKILHSNRNNRLTIWVTKQVKMKFKILQALFSLAHTPHLVGFERTTSPSAHICEKRKCIWARIHWWYYKNKHYWTFNSKIHAKLQQNGKCYHFGIGIPIQINIWVKLIYKSWDVYKDRKMEYENT